MTAMKVMFWMFLGAAALFLAVVAELIDRGEYLFAIAPAILCGVLTWQAVHIKNPHDKGEE